MGAEMLNVTISGPDEGLPVLLAHGLFGSGRNLGGLARRLAGRRVISVDMRNHGDSFAHGEHGYADLAGDLVQVIDAFGGQADVVGHSMGGKAAMAMALSAPDRLRRLVVLDIAPIAYPHSQNALIDAMRALDLTGLTRRSQADARLAERVPDAGVRAFLLQSLDLKRDPPEWKLNLDVLNHEMAEITGWPSDYQAAQFNGPALFLAGGRSDYVDAEGRAAIARSFPQAQVATIADAGHWLHAEAPAETGDAVAAFLAD